MADPHDRDVRAHARRPPATGVTRRRRTRSGWPWRRILGRAAIVIVSLGVVCGFVTVVAFVAPRMSERGNLPINTSYLPLDSELIVQVDVARLRTAGNGQLRRRLESVPRPFFEELSLGSAGWFESADRVSVGFAPWDGSPTFEELSGAGTLLDRGAGDDPRENPFVDLGDAPGRAHVLDVLGLGDGASTVDLSRVHWTAVVHAPGEFVATDTPKAETTNGLGVLTADPDTLVLGNEISIEDAILLGGEVERLSRFEFVDGAHDVVVALRPREERRDSLRGIVRSRLDAEENLPNRFGRLTENVLEGTLAVAVTLDFAGDVVIGLSIETSGNERAERMATDVAALLQSAREVAAASAEDDWHAYHWAALLEAAEVSTSRSTVRVVTRQPADRLGDLLDLAGDTCSTLLPTN